jgi:hypothetical protein
MGPSRLEDWGSPLPLGKSIVAISLSEYKIKNPVVRGPVWEQTYHSRADSLDERTSCSPRALLVCRRRLKQLDHCSLQLISDRLFEVVGVVNGTQHLNHDLLLVRELSVELAALHFKQLLMTRLDRLWLGLLSLALWSTVIGG